MKRRTPDTVVMSRFACDYISVIYQIVDQYGFSIDNDLK